MTDRIEQIRQEAELYSVPTSWAGAAIRDLLSELDRTRAEREEIVFSLVRARAQRDSLLVTVAHLWVYEMPSGTAFADACHRLQRVADRVSAAMEEG